MRNVNGESLSSLPLRIRVGNAARENAGEPLPENKTVLSQACFEVRLEAIVPLVILGRVTHHCILVEESRADNEDPPCQTAKEANNGDDAKRVARMAEEDGPLPALWCILALPAPVKWPERRKHSAPNVYGREAEEYQRGPLGVEI